MKRKLSDIESGRVTLTLQHWAMEDYPIVGYPTGGGILRHRTIRVSEKESSPGAIKILSEIAGATELLLSYGIIRPATIDGVRIFKVGHDILLDVPADRIVEVEYRPTVFDVAKQFIRLWQKRGMPDWVRRRQFVYGVETYAITRRGIWYNTHYVCKSTPSAFVEWLRRCHNPWGVLREFGLYKLDVKAVFGP